MVRKIFFLLSCFAVLYASAQQAKELKVDNNNYSVKKWKAYWITNPDIHLAEHSVVLFRRNFELDETAGAFIIHVSADNHYKLYVNGTSVCMGPARADLHHWRYETIDISPFLKKGKNTIAAEVVNWGHDRMKAQFSSKTAFLLQGHGEKEAFINSDDKHWKTYHNKGYRNNPVE